MHNTANEVWKMGKNALRILFIQSTPTLPLFLCSRIRRWCTRSGCFGKWRRNIVWIHTTIKIHLNCKEKQGLEMTSSVADQRCDKNIPGAGWGLDSSEMDLKSLLQKNWSYLGVDNRASSADVMPLLWCWCKIWFIANREETIWETQV
jgi:hypothetical protein